MAPVYERFWPRPATRAGVGWCQNAPRSARHRCGLAACTQLLQHTLTDVSSTQHSSVVTVAHVMFDEQVVRVQAVAHQHTIVSTNTSSEQRHAPHYACTRRCGDVGSCCARHGVLLAACRPSPASHSMPTMPGSPAGRKQLPRLAMKPHLLHTRLLLTLLTHHTLPGAAVHSSVILSSMHT